MNIIISSNQQSKYNSLFHTQSLENQLLLIYNDADFHKDKDIYKCGMETSVPEAIKLLKLNSVISISSASVERSFLCPKTVKTNLCNKMG